MDRHAEHPTGSATDDAASIREASRLIEQGRTLLDAGNLDGAIESFNEATGYDPMNGAAWNDLAVALYQRGDRDMAIGCLYTAMKVDPSFADAAVNLATLLQEEGRPWDGVPALRSVLFHDNEDETVRQMLLGLGIGAGWRSAVVVVDPTSDIARVVNACLAESGYRIFSPDPAQVAAVAGDTTREVSEEEAWTTWLAMVRPDTILVDPAQPLATPVRRAAAQLGAHVNVLGENLPSGSPLVELARALTDETPSVQISWERVPRPHPALSVIVQVTHLAHAINVLDRLATQDLSPGMFEVIVVDRAWGEPATSLVDEDDYQFDLNVIRAEGAGLGHAHNLGVEQARGNWVVFFDEESRPHPANLRGHLNGQALSAQPRAILGRFSLHPNLIDNSLRRLFNDSNLLMPQPALRHGEVCNGSYFRTNNASLPTAMIRMVKGFDALFSSGLDDIDLGLRLQTHLGITVHFDATLWNDTDYPYSIADYQVEQLIKGWGCTQLARKHNLPMLLTESDDEVLNAAWFESRRQLAETQAPLVQNLASRVVAMCNAEEPYRKTGAVDFVGDVVNVIGAQAFYRGVCIARSGFRLEDERMPGTLSYPTLPVVVLPGGDVAATLDALADTFGSLQVFVPEPVDSPPMAVAVGGTAEALATGAPVIAWIEAGATPEPSWRKRLLEALEQWPDHGVAELQSTETTSNRPPAPAVVTMVRSVAEGLGDRLQECVASTRLASRVEALGYRFVSVAADTATTTEQTVQTSAPAEAEPVPSP